VNEKEMLYPSIEIEKKRIYGRSFNGYFALLTLSETVVV
jgi:hypothetical protein